MSTKFNLEYVKWDIFLIKLFKIQHKLILLLASLSKPDRTGRSDRDSVPSLVRVGAETGCAENRRRTGRTGPEPPKPVRTSGSSGSAGSGFFIFFLPSLAQNDVVLDLNLKKKNRFRVQPIDFLYLSSPPSLDFDFLVRLIFEFGDRRTRVWVRRRRWVEREEGRRSPCHSHEPSFFLSSSSHHRSSHRRRVLCSRRRCCDKSGKVLV